MLNTGLLARPWSCHRPRVEGYEPIISSRIERIGRRKRNSWRWSALINGEAMAFGHEDTKQAAESVCARMLNAYTKMHYVSV